MCEYWWLKFNIVAERQTALLWPATRGDWLRMESRDCDVTAASRRWRLAQQQHQEPMRRSTGRLVEHCDAAKHHINSSHPSSLSDSRVRPASQCHGPWCSLIRCVTSTTSERPATPTVATSYQRPTTPPTTPLPPSRPSTSLPATTTISGSAATQIRFLLPVSVRATLLTTSGIRTTSVAMSTTLGRWRTLAAAVGRTETGNLDVKRSTQ